MLAILVVALAWDVFAGYMGWQNTESWILHTTGHRHPILVLAAGILIGHLFIGRWPAVFSFACQESWLPLIAGIVAGWLLWGQG